MGERSAELSRNDGTNRFDMREVFENVSQFEQGRQSHEENPSSHSQKVNGIRHSVKNKHDTGRQITNSSNSMNGNHGVGNNHIFLTSQLNNGNESSTNIAGQSQAQQTTMNGGLRYIDQFPKVTEIYGQLNQLVGVLQEKVDGVIERNEAEFLLAYKDQMFKVRKELQEMKNRMDEQDKRMKDGDQIDQMEKQLSWFRDESLQLYNKLAQKDKQIADLKHIVGDQKKDLEFQEGQMTTLKKKVRLAARKATIPAQEDALSASNTIASLALDEFNITPKGWIIQKKSQLRGGIADQKVFGSRNEIKTAGAQPTQRTLNLLHNRHQGSKRPHSQQLSQNYGNGNSLRDVAEQSETLNTHRIDDGDDYFRKTVKFEGWLPQSESIYEMILKNGTDHVTLVKQMTQLLRMEDDKRVRQLKQLKEKLEKVVRDKLTQNVVRNDLESFFLECIETVRKQIIKRKPPTKNDSNQLNFFLSQIKDYTVFRNEDKIKILELLFTNERLLMFVFQKMFPRQAKHDLIQNPQKISEGQPSHATDNDVNQQTEELADLVQQIGTNPCQFSSEDYANLQQPKYPAFEQRFASIHQIQNRPRPYSGQQSSSSNQRDHTLDPSHNQAGQCQVSSLNSKRPPIVLINNNFHVQQHYSSKNKTTHSNQINQFTQKNTDHDNTVSSSTKITFKSNKFSGKSG